MCADKSPLANKGSTDQVEDDRLGKMMGKRKVFALAHCPGRCCAN